MEILGGFIGSLAMLFVVVAAILFAVTAPIVWVVWVTRTVRRLERSRKP